MEVYNERAFTSCYYHHGWGKKETHLDSNRIYICVCVWGGEWVIFLRETLIVESMYFKESEVRFKYEFKFWFGC